MKWEEGSILHIVGEEAWIASSPSAYGYMLNYLKAQYITLSWECLLCTNLDLGCAVVKRVSFYLKISVATVHTKQIYLDLHLKEFAIDSFRFYHWFSKRTFFYPVNIHSLSFGLKTIFGDLRNPAMQSFLMISLWFQSHAGTMSHLSWRQLVL